MWGLYPGFCVPHLLPLPVDPRAALNYRGAHHQKLDCSAELEQRRPHARVTIAFALNKFRPCLAGLHERLQDWLRPEPCQTRSSRSAPAPEPREPADWSALALAEPRNRGSIQLRAAPQRKVPALPPGGHAAAGGRRGTARGEEDGRWELAAAEGGRAAAVA